MVARIRNPFPYSGVVLRDWLDGMDVAEVSQRLGMPSGTFVERFEWRCGISAGMALRLEVISGTGAELRRPAISI